jgi:hypothetical protein
MSSQFNAALWGGGTPVPGTVTVTANNLIYGALRLLGVLRPGQTASSDSMSDGLTALNEMLDSWNTERLTVRAIVRDTYDLNAGQATQTVGPDRIEAVGILLSGQERPLELYTLGRWAAIADKSAQGTPCGIWVENTVPEATVHLNPVPEQAYSLALYRWQTLDMFADLTTVYGFPPGYALALRYNLAAVLAPAFVVLMKIAQPLLASIETKAVEYKGKIKSFNTPVEVLRSDDALLSGGGWDWRTGEVR